MSTSDFTVGDEVSMWPQYGMRPVSIHKITRVLKRFVELDNGAKFGHDGWAYPKSHGGRAHIKHATDEDRKSVARQRALSKFKRYAEQSRLMETETIEAAIIVFEEDPNVNDPFEDL